MTDLAIAPVPGRGRSLGWWGMAMLIAAEGALFAMMIGTYFYLRVKNVAWPPAGIPKPALALPLILLGVLVLTSGPMQLAARAADAGRLAAARLLLLTALVVQGGYFGVQVHEFRADLHDFTPQQHAYGSIYATLLGADHAHVALGLLLNVWLLAKLATGLTRYRRNAVQAVALYWHAVNLITVVVTLTLLSPAL